MSPPDLSANGPRIDLARAGSPAVGTRIREARTAAGLTQDDLAGALGVTQTCVSYWEAARRDLGASDLLRVAEALKVPAASLLPSG